MNQAVQIQNENGRSVVNGTNLKVKLGTGRMGAVTNGAVGGHGASAPQIMAVPFARDIAHELGVDEAKALDLLKVIGRVAQSRILDGHPCGIPFLGVIAVYQIEVDPARMDRAIAKKKDRLVYLKKLKAAGYPGTTKVSVDSLIKATETALDNLHPIQRGITLRIPHALRRFYRENARYYAHVKDITRKVWEQLPKAPKRARTVSTSTYHLPWTVKKAKIEAGIDLPRPNPKPNIPKETAHVDQLPPRFSRPSPRRRARA